MKKKLSEIIRTEWIAFNWLEITEMGDDDRIFMVNHRRTPEEAMQAMNDWDATIDERSMPLPE